MSPRTVERVDDWETVPFGGGYSGLRDLASQEFSGVVTAGPTRLFMIRGTVVGVLDGSIDDFEGASGTAREAPHPALPLLAVMQERSDEVRAKYYTEDTPIADVDRTLADGSFTGFVELSENVLSGDYYQVYHQGRSMSVAYVGTSERLITDDEAFEQANDEVGIYEVRPVGIDAIDIPAPADDAGSGAATGDDETPAATAAGDDEPEPTSDDATASDTDAGDVPSGTSASEQRDPAAGESTSSAAAPDTGSSDAADADGARADSSDSDAGTARTRTRSGADADQREPDTTGPDEPPADDGGAADAPSGSTGESSTTSTGEPSSATTDDTATADDDTSTASRSPGRDGTGSESDPSDSESSAGSADETHPGANVSSSSSASSSSSTPSQQPGVGTERQSASADRQSSPSAGGTDRAQADQSPGGTANSSQAESGQADGTRASAPSSGTGASDLEVRSIPSLDPARTSAASKATAKRSQSGRSGGTSQPSQSGATQPRQQNQRRQQNQAGQQDQRRSSDQATQRSAEGSTAQSPQDSSPQPGDARRSGAEQQAETAEARETTESSATSGSEPDDIARELESREQEIEDLRTDLERVEAERDELETKATELESERDRLQAELEEARAEIDRLTERLDDFAAEGEAAGTQLTASEAIDNTNLFVRYRSKGDATLETAHSGNADRSAVEENMRLEYHTQFDADDAAVGNEPFDEFLRETIQYRFVDWLIRSLLYEVRDTGHADGMADLYNALPKIDRAELNGQVSVNYTEDGEEHRSQERFDVVVRDRMGNPLVVANINNSRDPATDAMMTDLVKRAERVGESSETLAGAFLVTESFFEPEALETAEGATSSGLFSRDKRKSFVNLSRKGGYHLCLVEARNQEFHLAVPEL